MARKKKIMLRFELTFPNVGSWNGKHAGKKDNCYLFIRLPQDKAETLSGKYFHYDFGDGWSAGVYATKAPKSKTAGFRGYDWMVSEIVEYGRILKRAERHEMKAENNYKF